MHFLQHVKEKKFKIRKLKHVIEDLEMASIHYRNVKKIFLADADAFVLGMDTLDIPTKFTSIVELVNSL